MNVDNAAEDSPSLQFPNVLVPPKTQRVQSPCRGSSLWCTSLLGLTHAFGRCCTTRSHERPPFDTLSGYEGVMSWPVLFTHRIDAWTLL